MPTINLFTTESKTMGDRKNKISRGLHKLLQSKHTAHFNSGHDVFIGDPNVRNNYFELFSQAQLTEIAYSDK